MANMGNRGWNDKLENYCDGYVIKVVGSTATAIQGDSYIQPAAIYGLSIAVNPSVGSGLVDIIDSSATGNADTTVWSVRIASGADKSTFYHMNFPRGLACNNGIVVTATTITGSISLLYKPRY